MRSFDSAKADLIGKVCDEIISGKLEGEFPLVVGRQAPELSQT